MKTKLLKLLTLTLGIAAGSAAYADGHIYEILPCTESGMTLTGPISSTTAPLTGGEKVCFKLRLARTLDMFTAGKQWTYDYIGLGSPTVDEFYSPLMIGIYVSGRLTYARYVGYFDPNSNLRDFVFEYDTKVGDFALPILLAGSDGKPAGESNAGANYTFLNNDKWGIICPGTSDSANFWYAAAIGTGFPPISKPEGGVRVSDYSLRGAGFYVKTIDFDPEWESSAYWRMVHAGSTITDSLTPKIVADSVISNAVTVHVWSENDDIIRIKGGRTVHMLTEYGTGGTEIYKDIEVGDIVISQGKTYANFTIEAVGTEGETTQLVLSAFDGYAFNSLNQKITDYLTVPVSIIEALPPSLIVETDAVTIEANHERFLYSAQLTVYLSQPYTSPVEVMITPTFEDGYTGDWADYVRFMKTQGTSTTLPPATDASRTVTIAPGTKQTLFLYALRSDSDHTLGDGHQIILNPTFVGANAATADADIPEKVPAGIWITSQKAKITTPDSTSEYSVTAGETLEINVAVEDTYADTSDTTIGYTVQIKTGSSAMAVTLPEKYKASGDGGGLVGLISGNSPSIEYPSAGDQTSMIRVMSPINPKGWSDWVSFTVHVAAPTTTSATVVDNPDDDPYYEGDLVKFKIALSAPNPAGVPIYAFLVNNEGAELDMFAGTASKCIITDPTQAYPLSVGRQISAVGSEASGSFLVLDGLSIEDGGFDYSFSVVLCSTSYYDPATRLAGFPTTDMLHFLVYNKEPTIDTVCLNGFEAEGDGFKFTQQFPKGMTLRIQPQFDDVSYDLNHGFIYKWTASKDGQQKATGTVGHLGSGADLTYADGTSINDAFLPYQFNQAGDWTIKIQMRDKDMSKWSAITYTIGVTILDQPQVVIKPEDNYLENAMKQYISVGLGYYESDIPIWVKLTVTPPAGDNPGRLRLSDEFKVVPTGYPDLAANEYYVSFDSASEENIWIDDMDGTMLSSSKGFTIMGEVVSTEDSIEPGVQWKDYYKPYSTKVYIENVAPVLGGVTPENSETNAWKVSGGVATSYPIRWAVRSDVDHDLDAMTDPAFPAFPHLKVTVTGCDNADQGTFFFPTPEHPDLSGVFYPDFGNAQGIQTVILTIEDKDGGYYTYTYFYEITPSKFLQTQSTGPNGGEDSSNISKKYANAKGIGEGHTFVDKATFSSAENFVLSWNCGNSSSARVYAFGYKVAAPDDNGGLDNGLDRAIDPAGRGTTAAPYYHYPMADAGAPEDQKDSFFYTWIFYSASDSGTSLTPEIPNGTISPERFDRISSATVLLPTARTEDGGYIDTLVEAIFAKEWMASDNCGDINQDGIPDIYAIKKWDNNLSLIETVTGQADIDGDLLNLAKSNPDEDYLPGVWVNKAEISLIENSDNSYAPIGCALTTRRELRGFHDGLNATDLAHSDIDFSEDEMNAWTAYANANGLDPAAPNLAVWSPEPHTAKYARMDPTNDDTDGDDMPDGWEYFFWYQAHVWVPAGNGDYGAPRPGQRFVFERFNIDPMLDPDNYLLRGIEIPAEEVERHFNPCDPLFPEDEDIHQAQDFDMDGLTDFEELLIGTNPCHWDTDGDQMCDGWEVMMCLNPIGAQKQDNQDGDAMACAFFTQPAFYDPDDNAHDKFTGLEITQHGSWSYDVQNYLIEGRDYRVVNQNAANPDGSGNVLQRCVIINHPDPYEVPMMHLYIRKKINEPTEDYTYGLSIDDEQAVVHPRAPQPWPYGIYVGEHMNPRFWLEGPWITRTFVNGDVIYLDQTMILLHDMVKTYFGFDPRTGWHWNATGFLTPRWETDGETGVIVNTIPYCDYDEYLLMKYRQDFTCLTPETDYQPEAPFNTLKGWTTQPSVVYSVEQLQEIYSHTNGTGVSELEMTNLVATASISETLIDAFAQAGGQNGPVTGHGADTDGDGMADGWELYVSLDPNLGSDAQTEELPPDHIVAWEEFAGTDVCNVYKTCESIYKNHPGITRGWYNKFFPTDPMNIDTDGDGVLDGVEGESWVEGMTINGLTYPDIEKGFIYGGPTDDGVACCIRGGGMNPCTVDTDLDGLPDFWERQFAGLIVNSGTKQYVAASDALDGTAEGNTNEVAFGDDVWLADGLIASNVTIKVHYITCGMDATWGGDADSSARVTDTRINTVRDLDFDHDGLENFQEYLVQSIRHFRYDDITTPLMGRILAEGFYDPLRGYILTTPHIQEFHKAPVQFDAGLPDKFLVNAVGPWQKRSPEEVLEEFNNWRTGYTAVNPQFAFEWDTAGWKENGYFAPPDHEWDRLIASGAIIPPFVMFVPNRCSGYVSCDPFNADTDGDGMDDHWELFHGLNPILGSVNVPLGDIIALKGPNPATYNALWNEWTHPDYNFYWMAFNGAPPVDPVRDPAGGMHGTDPLQAPLSGLIALDPILYPWIVGAASLDPDGDGLRNDEERILANVTSPVTHHTDPSPLWMTDSSNPMSYVAQYYGHDFASGSFALSIWPSLGSFPTTTKFAYEENEGYDTDNDWGPDGREIVKTVRAASDPERFSDPDRRQALYLEGSRSFAMTFCQQRRPDEYDDFFRQFTVECWVFPERAQAQVFVDRACLYDGDANVKDEGAIRSNFRIGMTSDGRAYGMFDNNDSILSGLNEPVSCQSVVGEQLDLNVWTHVALTYDGKDLRLYVNGQMVKSAKTSLIPANGILSIEQNPTSTNTFPYTSSVQMLSSIYVGARPIEYRVPGGCSIPDHDGPCEGCHGGQFALTPSYICPLGYHHEDSWNMQEFFKGWIDEVRIWDGARTEADIAGNYLKRFGFNEATTNREEVYQVWAEEGTRNDNDGKPTLPVELVYHFDFMSNPGVLDLQMVAKTPAAFKEMVLDQAEINYDTAAGRAGSGINPDVGVYPNIAELKGGGQWLVQGRLLCGWWDACLQHNTVYSDYHVVPWIQNTVGHLAYLDGATVDSELFGENAAGRYMLPSGQGLKKFSFRNTAIPCSYYVTGADPQNHIAALTRLSDSYLSNEEVADIAQRFQFDALRSRISGNSDLLPMYDAFPKLCPALWDGQGPSSAWEYTAVDTDADGLPDWWEEIAAGYSPELEDGETDVNWNTMVTYNGHRMPAWEAYLRDLAAGMQPDGSILSDYREVSDADGDGLPDWWQYLYAISGGSEDTDGDGLSNYVEYLLSEVFDLGLRFDPNDATSVNPYISDYFYRINQLYVGEIFTDHDRVEDSWEKKSFAKDDDVSPYLYDADKDPDGDGWSNYAEFQAGTDPIKLASLGVDAIQMSEYPIPTIELHVSYKGNQNIADMPMVVQAWRDQTLVTIPDAKWTIGGEGDVTLIDTGTAGSGTASNVVNGTKHLGMNPRKELLLHLSPGSIVAGSVTFEFKDLTWILANTETGEKFVNDPATATWEGFIIDRQRKDDRGHGDIIDQTTLEVFGTIDYETGAVTFDCTKLPEVMTIDGDISGQRTDANWVSIYKYDESYIRVTWQSKPITGGNSSTYYLSEPDPRSAENNSLGHLREGKNTFVAFYDLDQDGMYTPGEPYGFVKDVDVGWNYAKVKIGMTDTIPVFARYKLTLGGSSGGNGTEEEDETADLPATDREAMYRGAEDVVSTGTSACAPEQGHVRIRIVRFAVQNLGKEESKRGFCLLKDEMAIVYDRVLTTADGEHPTITEADILNHIGNEFDLDWDAPSIDGGVINKTRLCDLCTTLAGSGADSITNVFYTIHVGNGDIYPGSFTNGYMLAKSIVRKFDRERHLPTTIGPGIKVDSVVNSPRPTFKWSLNGFDTYTAFKIRITGGGKTWESDYQLMPVPEIDGAYSSTDPIYTWTPPMYAGSKSPDGEFEFKNGEVYSWKIQTYNAKYRETRGDAWVDGGSFKLNAITNSLDYGQIDCAIRYYGPDAVANGLIRVQAFSSPDFSGDPIAEGYVTSKSDIRGTNAIDKANAVIIGLKAGTYYLRAFIDTNLNGQRDKWESWGCCCAFDTPFSTLFTPKSVTIGPDTNSRQLIKIFIDDCDTDQDCLPDAWEYVTYGSIENTGAGALNQTLPGGFVLRKEIAKEITASPLISGGLSVTLSTALSTPRLAAMIMGVDATGSLEEVADALATAGEPESINGSVAITGVELDKENRKIVLQVTADVEAVMGSNPGAAIYTFLTADPINVTCKVWRKETLVDAEWKQVAEKSVVIGYSEETVSADLGDDIDLSSGFFRITLGK